MAEKMFKEKFGNIKKIKVCTTSTDINFDSYTEPGTYEIYEDMKNGQSRIYLMTVDKSVSGACLKQTRVHCGIVDARQTNTAGAWTAWAAVTGGGSIDLREYVKVTDLATEETPGVVRLATSEEMGEARGDIAATPLAVEAFVYGKIGDISAALDELHAYAEALVGGAE